MTIDSQLSWYLDHELSQRRLKWVKAYKAWTQVADGKSFASNDLSDEQRAALRAYRDAETAYFGHRRMLTDKNPSDRSQTALPTGVTT